MSNSCLSDETVLKVILRTCTPTVSSDVKMLRVTSLDTPCPLLNDVSQLLPPPSSQSAATPYYNKFKLCVMTLSVYHYAWIVNLLPVHVLYLLQVYKGQVLPDTSASSFSAVLIHRMLVTKGCICIFPPQATLYGFLEQPFSYRLIESLLWILATFRFVK